MIHIQQRPLGLGNPRLWSPRPGTVDGSGQISESTSMKRRKRKDKNRRLEDDIHKHLYEILDQQ